ncbi:hypothetical protein [endosymbiont GvMRE of Glomus versiforme]|uniref:hypothetical protein n=1 Tax=endosymbiont GvMRE of Glomus versiforme TaxID=2039283 RepID=UPI000ECF75F5|nr:hypothetical protein [endosymbiont GvMRE of Glomus versiforme]RHZ36006.1 hypothetical protein GvMRE_Ic3g109 [endosymbiont GvMRE of Glomus versiforme]
MSKWDKIKKKDLKSLGEAPVEASENIQAPELAPRDKRFTGRNKRIAFTCRPEFAEELRRLAFEKNCYQIEILERAMEIYKKSLLSKSKKRETKKPLLNQFWKVNFICDNCQRKFIRDRVYSPAPDLDQLNQYPTYCVNCKKVIEEEKE